MGANSETTQFGRLAVNVGASSCPANLSRRSPARAEALATADNPGAQCPDESRSRPGVGPGGESRRQDREAGPGRVLGRAQRLFFRSGWLLLGGGLGPHVHVRRLRRDRHLAEQSLPRMGLAWHSRNQTQASDFYRRFRRFDLDKTKGTDDQWLGSERLGLRHAGLDSVSA